MRVTPAAFESLARQYVNAAYIQLGNNRPLDLRQFKSFFKLCPVGVASLWYALEEICSGCVHNDGVGPPLSFTVMKPEHLLLCLNFMKTYSGVSVGASLFGVSEKTHRRYFWAMVCYLGHLASCTVSSCIQKLWHCLYVNLTFYLLHTIPNRYYYQIVSRKPTDLSVSW